MNLRHAAYYHTSLVVAMLWNAQMLQKSGKVAVS